MKTYLRNIVYFAQLEWTLSVRLRLCKDFNWIQLFYCTWRDSVLKEQKDQTVIPVTKIGLFLKSMWYMVIIIQ